ncbi:hypothetical protein PDESU_00649 [Pontiella desulfatans]|uniref:DUF1800 domain-containing protein n=1 Tax=Pontiella desulfatans TaxID=2750659 RepID=A0A6C2TWX2_PONDE|nr:DUF1800 family protein [Pontiella desulfatans]VGO12099.1 hypothetical protein PDESU_00649 [Pontiella desulfatans]
MKTTLPVIAALSLLAPLCQSENELGQTVSNGQFAVILPSAATSNQLRMVEWSTDLVNWEPVARDYGFDWGNAFPHALPISTGGVHQVLSDPTSGMSRFYRVVSSATSGLDNTNSVSRFLQQATFGPTRSSIAGFPGLDDPNLNDPPYTNYLAWIDDQMALPTNSHRAFWRERSNPAFTNNPANAPLYEIGHNTSIGQQLTYYWNNDDGNGSIPYKADTNDAIAVGRKYNDVEFNTENTKKIVWYQMAITAEDQLRQRMAWALSQIFVVGENGSNQASYTGRWVTYYDIFVRNAFGNFRDILGEVTYSPHMGRYLTFDSNKKADESAGTFPDENYAREIMQLFTIGLWELNQDGTPVLDAGGNLIPTYDNDDITEFAKIFTGLKRHPKRGNTENADNYIDPSLIRPDWHDLSQKTLLDGSVQGPFPETEQGVRDDIDGLLDHLHNHPNTPPFIARILIQRFTISNPSPQYIFDVAQAFIDGTYTGEGSGIRGDLGAVAKAILLHPEARETALANDAAHGKLHEPLIRLMNYARAFEITSPQTYGFFPFHDLAEVFAQSPYDYPSVFSFYLPDYQPIGPLLDRNLNAPEFQIHNDVTALSLPNALWWLVHEGITRDLEVGIGQRWYSQGDLDLTHETALAADAAALIDHLDTMLTAGRLRASNRATLIGVVDAMPGGTEAERAERARRALWLFSMLPEFNVLY